jgi:hypothetical protein
MPLKNFNSRFWVLETLSCVNKSGKVTDYGAMIEISDFSNVSGTYLSLIPKYEALDTARRPSKISTPDLIVSKIVKCHNRSKM